MENLKHTCTIHLLSGAQSKKFDGTNEVTKNGQQVYALAIKSKEKKKINDVEYESETVVKLKSLVEITKPGVYNVALEQFIMAGEGNSKKPQVHYRVIEILPSTSTAKVEK